MWNKHGKAFFSLADCLAKMTQTNELTYVTVVFYIPQYSLNPLCHSASVWPMTCEVKTAILYLYWTARWQMERGPIDMFPCFQGFVLYQFELLASPISRVMTYRWSIYRTLYWQYTIIMTYCWRRLQCACQMKGGSNRFAPMLSGMCSTSIQTFRHHQFQESWPIVEDNRNVPLLGLPSIRSYDVLSKMITLSLSDGVGPINRLTLLWLSTIFYRRCYRLWIITLYSTRLVIPLNL